MAPPDGRLEAGDKATDGGLTAAGLADEAVGLALLDRDGDAVDGGDDALLALEEARAGRLVLARSLLDVEQCFVGDLRDVLGRTLGLGGIQLALEDRGGLVALLHRVVAGESVGIVPAQARVAGAALVGGPQAAGREAAAHRQVGQRWGSTRNREKLGACCERTLGQCRHQRARVAVLRLGEQRLRRRGLDDTTGVHDGNTVGVTGHDTQVVGDEDDAHLVLVAQLVDEVEDLHLRRHVQGRRRLVRDEDARLADEGHGDHDALTHAARRAGAGSY